MGLFIDWDAHRILNGDEYQDALEKESNEILEDDECFEEWLNKHYTAKQLFDYLTQGVDPDKDYFIGRYNLAVDGIAKEVLSEYLFPIPFDEDCGVLFIDWSNNRIVDEEGRKKLIGESKFDLCQNSDLLHEWLNDNFDASELWEMGEEDRKNTLSDYEEYCMMLAEDDFDNKFTDEYSDCSSFYSKNAR